MPHPPSALPPLIHALLSPGRHGPGVGQVELLETAISWVLLAGDLAYKIKKPLKLSFLDFSTLALRKHCCEEELRLNRRYAPDLYLAVVPLFHTPEDPQWCGSGAPIEYAVKMRRFAQSGRLDHVCDQGELLPRHLSGLAHSLTAFHAAAAVVPPGSYFGSAACVREQALQNFDDLRTLVQDSALQQRLQALQSWTEQQHGQLAARMERRHDSGHVRECHGDLHLGNLVLLDQTIRLFDCIEFSESLRWIDVASELAFLYVDLRARQQNGLACWLVNEALSDNGDYGSVLLLRFYAVYRALVRTKVAFMQATQNGSSTDAALHYLALAEKLSLPPPISLCITHGVSGSGKTFGSNAVLLGDATACTIRLRTDVERKRLSGLQSLEPSGAALNTGIYAPQAHATLYAHLLTLAEGLLQAGWSVLVDGTFLHRVDRDRFAALAAQHHAAFGILAPQATPEQLRQRIQQRQASSQDASEATLEVLQHQLQELEPLAADEPLWSPASATPPP
ncbi:hypothetical protein DIC66_15255 [Rhodoferax lacus]|uniref:Aminoglycoside phosphotransferase domain-containing protein n=1 Tax=Rhodoferax lacus TaxID=2184758 RepID=A0A3E1R9N5_9BURK|nr:bifunctional aminoglycoside phosphotransferase/ATP-binding protein [Rhodoferax lacus]RFO96074.1 hypothetical protein DIC66_15255 [Rhodoferax lacus]